MHRSCLQTSKQAQPPFLTRFSASLSGIKRTCKIHGGLGEALSSGVAPKSDRNQKSASVYLIPVTLVQLILLARLLVVVFCHVYANRHACINGFARASFYCSLSCLNRSLYFFFDSFRLFNGFVFSRFISNLDIERSYFLQSLIYLFQGCPKLLNHTFDDR